MITLLAIEIRFNVKEKLQNLKIHDISTISVANDNFIETLKRSKFRIYFT